MNHRHGLRWVAGAVVLVLTLSTMGQDKPLDLSALKENQAVQVREGDSYSKATFIKREGRKIQIKYEDGTTEWVTADRLRLEGDTSPVPPANDAKKPEAPKSKYPVLSIGDRVQIKDGPNWYDGRVINKRGEWYYVEFARGSWQGWYDWVEPWRIRKYGSDYDVQGWVRGHAATRKMSDPPTPKPGPSPEEAEKEGKGGADAPAADTTVEIGIAVTEATRSGRDILPVARKWSFVPGVPEGQFKAPSSPEPTVLPALAEGTNVRSMRLFGKRGLINVEGRERFGLIRIDLAGNSFAAIELKGQSEAMDISPSGKFVVARSAGSSVRHRRIDIYKIGGASGRESEPLICFFPQDVKDRGEITDAVFIDDQTLLTLGGGELVCWDFAKATSLWRLAADGEGIEFMPDGKAVVVGCREGIVILEIPSGNVLGLIDGTSRGAMAITPDGKTLFSYAPPMLQVWDLQTGQSVSKFGLPNGVAGQLVATSSKYALIGNVLISIPKRTAVWRYEGEGAQTQNGDRIYKIYSDGKRTILTNDQLPHAAAIKAAEKAREGDMMFCPGDRITLDIQAEVDDNARKQIITSLARQIVTNGMSVADGQPLKIVARTGEVRSETRTYQRWGQRSPWGPGGGMPAPETVTITRKSTVVSAQLNDVILWQTSMGSSNDPGMFVLGLRTGQSVQDMANQRSLGGVAGWMTSLRLPTNLAMPVNLQALPASQWALGGVKD